jgi:hypothetical protein
VLLLVALVFVGWLLSSRFLHHLVPSDSLLAFGLVAIVILVLFQLGEVS